jgi:hypothetical protein
VQDEIERAIEGTRSMMGEQVAALEKEIDVLAEKNARLICKHEMLCSLVVPSAATES